MATAAGSRKRPPTPARKKRGEERKHGAQERDKNSRTAQASHDLTPCPFPGSLHCVRREGERNPTPALHKGREKMRASSLRKGRENQGPSFIKPLSVSERDRRTLRV